MLIPGVYVIKIYLWFVSSWGYGGVFSISWDLQKTIDLYKVINVIDKIFKLLEVVRSAYEKRKMAASDCPLWDVREEVNKPCM